LYVLIYTLPTLRIVYNINNVETIFLS